MDWKCIERNAQVRHTVVVRRRRLPARTLTWIDGRISAGTSSVASRSCRIATNSSSPMPSLTWMLSALCSATVVCQRAGREAGG